MKKRRKKCETVSKHDCNSIFAVSSPSLTLGTLIVLRSNLDKNFLFECFLLFFLLLIVFVRSKRHLFYLISFCNVIRWEFLHFDGKPTAIAWLIRFSTRFGSRSLYECDRHQITIIIAVTTWFMSRKWLFYAVFIRCVRFFRSFFIVFLLTLSLILLRVCVFFFSFRFRKIFRALRNHSEKSRTESRSKTKQKNALKHKLDLNEFAKAVMYNDSKLKLIFQNIM